MSEYASNQPAGFQNSIERVAIAGAGGTIGSNLTRALLQTGKHTITALTREGSTSKLPAGVKSATVSYDDEATLVAALRGQQFFIITVAPGAPRDTHSKLVRAAAAAGVPYVMPNGYGPDVLPSQLSDDTILGTAARAARDEIESLGMRWVSVCCGFWYDYSLAGGPARFGFDFAKRTATLFDDGRTAMSTSTLAQVGRAVAAVLSLPVLPQNEDAGDDEVTLSRWFNKGLYIKSFVVSQRDMLASAQRVTGTGDSDWTVTEEPAEQRYKDGLARVKTGDMTGFPQLLYSRSFFKADAPDFSDKVVNKLLGLPEEDLDASTKVAIQMALEQGTPRAH